MASVLKSVIVAHSCTTMYGLVDDVAAYPGFLPWCARTEVFEDGEAHMRARIDIDYHGLRAAIMTRNAKEPPRRLALAFVEGPFERFQGEWRFTPLGEDGCRVEFALDYALAAGAFESLLAPVFGQIMDTLVDRFVERADELAHRGAA